ncbi:hypothetical protein JTE90_015291 [Oedothorax gibbosus]|uniref:Uncharacterized protein n=1 Tax=Oedothorax gibbosus TaxID=931172 RepID=A0AAV6VPR3_9ARAC|nr:hypothetical protein JTE90_015291 [Oedothorax gibbosus]
MSRASLLEPIWCPVRCITKEVYLILLLPLVTLASLAFLGLHFHPCHGLLDLLLLLDLFDFGHGWWIFCAEEKEEECVAGSRIGGNTTAHFRWGRHSHSPSHPRATKKNASHTEGAPTKCSSPTQPGQVE